MDDSTAGPGSTWLEIVSRTTLDAFAQAFSSDPLLDASVLPNRLEGVRSLYAYFAATRSMFDRIRFSNEIRTGSHVCIEWEGTFRGNDIGGATILSYDDKAAIEHVRIFCAPVGQVSAFAAELSLRLPGQPTASPSMRARSYAAPSDRIDDKASSRSQQEEKAP
jgi:hypothetical protein